MAQYSLDFNESQSMQNMIKPLESLGITGFFFIRMYPDGQFVDLTSDPNWAEFFFKKLYNQAYNPNAINNHFLPANGVSLSVLNPHNEVWKDGKEYFNVGNGIILTKQFQDYHESYYFYADKDNHIINEFYLNNLDLLYRFIDYFKENAREFISKGEANKFYTPEKYLTLKSEPLLETPECLAVKQIMHTFQEANPQVNPMQSLSKKEIQCLYYLVQGKSAAEIATILCRSKRTVEQHIENAKHKLNCHKISQLAYLLGKMDIERLLSS